MTSEPCAASHARASCPIVQPLFFEIDVIVSTNCKFVSKFSDLNFGCTARYNENKTKKYKILIVEVLEGIVGRYIL